MKKRFIILMIVIISAAFVISGCAGNQKTTVPAQATPSASDEEKINIFVPDEEGNLLITAESLKTEEITFIRPLEDSKLEILARKDEKGNVKIALGTCQSCNGSPMAFYTQTGKLLKCNNCGQTFPISVVDNPGGGCHPIMIRENLITETDDGVLLNMEEMKIYEPLFAKVAEH